MKKTILGILAATTILATNVSVMNSAHAAGSCSGLDHGPQFNKTELSAFDKCWLNTHRADKLSGVDGNVFWMKVDGKFISMPAKDLYQSGSKQAAKKMVTTKIVEKIVEVESGTVIDALRIQIEDLSLAEIDGIRRIGELTTQLAAKTQELIAANARVSTLTAQKFVTNGTIARLNREVSNLNTQITNLSGELATIRAANATLTQEKTDLEATIATFRTRNGTLADRVTTLQAEVQAFVTRADNAMDALVNIRNLKINVRGWTHSADTARNNYTNPTPTTNEVANGQTVDNVSNISDNRGANRNYSVYIDNDPTDIVRGFGSSILSRVADLAENVYDRGFTDGYSEGFDEGYNQGYSDGYDDGYATGYADGFEDGVNSVR